MKHLCWIFAWLIGMACPAYPASAAQEKVKVAAIYAKSGIAAQDNMELFQAVRFAVDQFNAQAGPDDTIIELLEYDNHSTPIQSRLAAKKAVKDGAVAVIGASWSSHSMAMAPYLQKKRIPMLSSDSTNPKVTQIGDFIFRACFDDNYQGKVLAWFARDHLKGKTAVVLQNINSDYSMGLTESFEREFDLLGGQVLKILNYKAELNDFRTLLAEAQTLDPDILFFPGHNECGFATKQAQDMGLRAKLLGGDGWPYVDFYANGGQDLKEAYYGAHWSKGMDSPKGREFIAAYGKNHDVSDFSAIAYDAAMLLFDAIKRAPDSSPAAIRDALAATKDFDAITGKITFDANGDPLRKQLVMMQIINGRPKLLEVVKPDSKTLTAKQ